MSTHRLMELLWGVEGAMICGGIFAMITLHRMHRMVHVMQGQIDEAITTQVLMQDHLDRIGVKLRMGWGEASSTPIPPRVPPL